MNCEVQHLEKNMRYRFLIINGEYYIMDMKRSFWKIIFPFLFWLTPSPVYKVDEHHIVEQLKGETIEKAESSPVSLGGFAYAIGILLAPLMGYFIIPSSQLTNIILLILTLITVSLLYFSISRKHKKKLESVIKIETLPRNLLWIVPSSAKLVFKLVAAYTSLLVFVIWSFSLYIHSGNIMVLILTSGLFYLLLLSSRVTVEEGNTTVRFKDYEKVI
ncbi:hypothetical protein AQ616_11870 [Oceanobacillus sp. E9]|uniref:DUF443 family protein n=1 Tax=Oceanobacillus kimchii TaxID=746691 RepID=A0ABQ5THL5_9BACI|nr:MULTISPECIES: DUF443 family protein [Oceanobacillus]OEH54449.1 hypothetical protein AQ616_11870 [Oceanobacillus sp. E9]GLO65761.1 hypothetical protein MACH08_15450 [Oceanobacillus kimchii]